MATNVPTKHTPANPTNTVTPPKGTTPIKDEEAKVTNPKVTTPPKEEAPKVVTTPTTPATPAPVTPIVLKPTTPPMVIPPLKFEDYANLEVAIRTFHGTYLRMDDKGFINQTEVGIAPRINEIWEIIVLDNDQFAFKNKRHGTYMKSNQVNHETWSAPVIGEYERFHVIDVGGEAFVFKNHHGSYVSARTGAEERAVFSVGSANIWETFKIENVSESLQVYDVVYDVDHSQILATIPKFIAGQTCTNNTDDKQSMSLNVLESTTMRSSSSQTSGIRVGMRVSMTAGIPQVAKMTVDVSTDYTQSWTSGEDSSLTRHFSATLPVLVPAHCMCSSRVSFTEVKLNVKWRGKAAFRGIKPNEKTVKTIYGVWEGVSVYDVNYTIDTPIKL